MWGYYINVKIVCYNLKTPHGCRLNYWENLSIDSLRLRMKTFQTNKIRVLLSKIVIIGSLKCMKVLAQLELCVDNEINLSSQSVKKYISMLLSWCFIILSFIWPCKSECQGLFSPLNAHIFCIWHPSRFLGLLLKDIANTLSLRPVWGLYNKKWQRGYLFFFFAKNKLLLEEVWISTIQKTGAWDNWGEFQLFREHLLATYGYFAQLTLLWALVSVHQRNI